MVEIGEEVVVMMPDEQSTLKAKGRIVRMDRHSGVWLTIAGLSGEYLADPVIVFKLHALPIIAQYAIGHIMRDNIEQKEKLECQSQSMPQLPKLVQPARKQQGKRGRQPKSA